MSILILEHAKDLNYKEEQDLSIKSEVIKYCVFNLKNFVLTKKLNTEKVKTHSSCIMEYAKN